MDLGPRPACAGRFDFHIHSLFSDGQLLPSEIVRRCQVLGHKVIAITDHVDVANLEMILQLIVRFVNEEKNLPLTVLPGVEITHVPPNSIRPLAKMARKLGGKIIIVHGETLSEPVTPGTNREAVAEKGLVDILAHPGLISEEDVIWAKKNDVYLELTSRSLHCLANGHVAKLASRLGAKMLVNTDSHGPKDFIDREKALIIAKSAGLNEKEAQQVTESNPIELLMKVEAQKI